MANPTTNYGWVMPTSASLVTNLPADFNVFGQGVDTSMVGLLGGTTGQVLSKTSGTSMAFTWVTPQVGDITGVTAGTGISGGGTSGDVTVTNSMATAITTNGDLIRGTGSGTFARLGIGSAGQVLTVAAGIPAWQAASGAINSNLCINGNFTINQRGYVSGANLSSGTYGFDRWKSNFTSTTLTYTSAPAGQSVTINSGGGLQQIVEQANVPAGSYVLSFAGTATGRIYNVGATAPSYAASPISFTADGLANVTIEFTATGATKTLSVIKLELGATASTYVYSGITIQGELAACQRYFAKSFDATTTPVNNGGTVGAITFARQATSGNVEPQTLVFNRTSMRVAPTITLFNPFTGTTGQWSDGSTASANARIIAQGQNSFVIDNTDVALAVANAQIQYIADSEL